MSMQAIRKGVRDGLETLPVGETGTLLQQTDAIFAQLEGVGLVELAADVRLAKEYISRVAGDLLVARSELTTYLAETDDAPADTDRLLPGGDDLDAQVVGQWEWLMTTNLDTFRGLDKLNEHFLKDFGIDIRTLIRNKVVCDMGSGAGGLAQSVAAEGIPVTVHSVNPRMAADWVREGNRHFSSKQLRAAYPHITDEEIARALEAHEERLVPRMAHESGLPDESCDVIFDVVAVSAYMSRMGDEGQELYRRTIKEYMRILKPGGMVLIIDIGRYALGYQSSSEGESESDAQYRERIVRSMRIPYEVIYTKDSRKHADKKDWMPYGAILRKPIEE